MPFIKVWIHFVWATKGREPFLVDEVRIEVFKHMFNNARKKGIYLDHINGYVDHAHCLISLRPNQTLSKIMNLIKGESSFWINRNRITQQEFEWQDDYYAASVSESGVEKVREYIRNQEEHHRNKTLEQEYEEILDKWGFQKFVG